MSLALQTAAVMVTLLIVMLAMGAFISVSVVARFMGGYLPGILWGAAVMVLAGIFAQRKGYVMRERVTLRAAVYAILDAIPSLLLIVIIIGGILKGVFTATEASAIAVAYAAILGLIYKGFKVMDLPRIILESAKMTGTITPPVGSILFTGCKVGGVKIEQVIKQLLPYFAVILGLLLLVTYLPGISMVLPRLFGLAG